MNNFLQKPKCRLKITNKCNLNCRYCINKSKEYVSKWIFINSIDEIDFSRFRSIIISGGEPTMLSENFLLYTLECIRKKAALETPIYLQTNGILLTKDFVKKADMLIDGIGLSIHDFDMFLHLLPRYLDINRIKPIRLYIQTLIKNNNFVYVNGLDEKFNIRWWNDGEFDSSENIFAFRKNHEKN